MELSEIAVGKNRTAREKAKALYRASFPKEEQLSFSLLRFLTIQKSVDFTAYYDGDTFCGFTYTVTAGKYLFVLFFAVDEARRGTGIGSAILSHLKAKGKIVILNVEPLEASAENFNERCRRFRFYEKNGFFDTGYDIEEIGGIFRVLATEPSLDIEAYEEVFRRMSFGLWCAKIMKA